MRMFALVGSVWSASTEYPKTHASAAKRQLTPAYFIISIGSCSAAVTMWPEATETENSFESSLLRPSPSTMSDVTRGSHFCPGRLFRVPSVTPTTQSMTLSTSSFTASSSSSLSCIMLQYSTTSMLSGFIDGEERIYEPPAVGGAPRTVSTLISTSRASSPHIPHPLPIPARAHTVTPEGSIIVSISTPCGSHGTGKATLSTDAPREYKKRRTASREIARKLDFLTKDLYRRDGVRRQESKETVDAVKILRRQLQDLRERHQERITVAPSIAMGARSKSVGSSNEITPLEYVESGNSDETLSPILVSSSIITSMGSDLPSFHSDDSIAEDVL
ncbi:hypothetical protein AX15_001858 [Amanita polypyramis BW_CC]|nr:hypothetical protein AX15_001858 [Amanita polypyramis BW_CC]